MVFAEEVLFEEQRRQLLLATLLWKYKRFEQLGDALIVDKVGAETQFAEFALWVSQYSLSNSSESGDPNSVVTHIKELQGCVYLQSFSNRSCTIHIRDVVEEIKSSDCTVLLHGFSHLSDTRDTKSAAAQVEILDATV